MALADLVVVMNNGRIEQAGQPARRLRRARARRFVARFMGDHNVIPGRSSPIGRQGRRWRCRAAAVRRPRQGRAPDEPIDIAVRPTASVSSSIRAAYGFTGIVSSGRVPGPSVKLAVIGPGSEDSPPSFRRRRSVSQRPVAVMRRDVRLNWADQERHRASAGPARELQPEAGDDRKP